MKKYKEKDLQRDILSLLHLKGFLAVKFPSIGTYVQKTGKYIPMAQVGVSDILACEPKTGRFWAIEVKMKGNNPTDNQVRFLDDVMEHGGVGLVAFSIDDVLKLFDK